jgi:hypothetical protein
MFEFENVAATVLIYKRDRWTTATYLLAAAASATKKNQLNDVIGFQFL